MLIDKIKEEIEFLTSKFDMETIEILLDTDEKTIMTFEKMPQHLRVIKIGNKEDKYELENNQRGKIEDYAYALCDITPMQFAEFLMDNVNEECAPYICENFVEFIKSRKIYINTIDNKFAERLFEHDKDRIVISYFQLLERRGIRAGIGSEIFTLQNKKNMKIFKDLINLNSRDPFDKYMSKLSNEIISLCSDIMKRNESKLTKTQFDNIIIATPDALRYMKIQLLKMLDVKLPTPRSINNIIEDALNLYN